MQKIKVIFDKIMSALMGIIMLLLVCSAIWQVFTRFVLKDPSLFTEEFSRYTLIWSGLLGAAYAFSKDMHLSLTLVQKKLTGISGKILAVFNELVVLSFTIFVLIMGGFTLCSKSNSLSAILRLPMGLVYSAVPIAGIIILLVKLSTYAELLINSKKGLKGEDN